LSASKIVITTIFPPSPAVNKFASLAGVELVVVGDKKTPPHWSLPGAEYFGWDDSRLSRLHSYKETPFNHYSRKNLGYLMAIDSGARYIIDTDDDNFPLENFGFPAFSTEALCTEENLGFINAYRFFTTQKIWPRGLPLAQVLRDDSNLPLSAQTVEVGVWQGLANGDPDVDAIYRLASNESCTFGEHEPVVLGTGTWSPFNSQNTLFRQELFPLLYLPISVTFRFTDILRSYVAQPIMWSLGFHLGFTNATVFQDRNPHNYIDDLESELPMYRASDSLNETLMLSQTDGESILDRLVRAYEALHRAKIVSQQELRSVGAWVADCQQLGFS